MIELPQEAKKAAQEVSKSRPKILVGIPNMLRENVYLTRRLFEWSNQRDKWEVGIHWVIEQRFHDHARNQLAQAFLKSEFEWLVMIDDDSTPHPRLLELVNRGKRVLTGVVFCFIKGQLMPSIWRLAPCEQCYNVQDFKEGKPPRDDHQYEVREDDDGHSTMLRWNPYRTEMEPFCYMNHGVFGYIGSHTCRCGGTGRDPWVFQCHPGAFEPESPFFKCDSMGGAALLVHRSVFEELSFPWFQFLYRKDRQILLTEDHFFAWKCREKGIEIWCDNQMPSNHFKTMDLLTVNQLMVRAMEFGRKSERDSKQESRIVIPKVSCGEIVRP